MKRIAGVLGRWMGKLEVLKSISFGARVAEDETSELGKYFVETDQWSRIFRGEVDVVRGEKGSGKSAIYSLLLEKTDVFFDKRILLIAAEKPRGAPVFKDIVAQPPAEEVEFIGLWKLYVLALIGRKMREFDIRGDHAETVYRALEEAKLIDRELDLTGILGAVRDLATKIFRAESIEGGVVFEPTTLIPAFTGKITFREPSLEMRARGFLSIDSLIKAADSALGAAKFNIWVLLDRLDVAFAETPDLEKNALRALFRAYRDINDCEFIRLKIFIRSDIWLRITQSGFREASHITKFVVLEWNDGNLLNLAIRRLLNNDAIVSEYKLDKDTVLGDFVAQRELFYRVFPTQVEQGQKRSSTFDWVVSRCADATGKTAPRELIHLLTSLRETEISRLERGEAAAEGELLFNRYVFKEALPAVSEARLHLNLLAEHPDLRGVILSLQGEKTEQTPESLSKIWNATPAEALVTAHKLVEIGLFQLRGSREKPTFWVPFLYRDALKLVQGLADESRSNGDPQFEFDE